MKRFVKYIVFIVLITSCKKDECSICLNNSKFDGTECICIEGYEGVNCEKEIRSRFYGHFKGKSLLNSLSESNAALSIVKAKDGIMNIIVEGINGRIISIDSFILHKQNVEDISGVEFLLLSGNGKLKKDSMFLDYKIKFQNQISTISFKGSR